MKVIHSRCLFFTVHIEQNISSI